MKFSSAALAVLPFPFVAFTQLVSRTKAASTTGLTIADGMVVELCKGSNITVDNEGDRSPALIVGDKSNGGASLTITGGSYKSIYGFGMIVYEGSVATVLGGTIQGGGTADGVAFSRDAIAVSTGAVATVLGGTIQGGQYGGGMSVSFGAVATVLGGTIQGGEYGDGMLVDELSAATVCDGTIQGGESGDGMIVSRLSTVRIAGGMMIGGNGTSPGYGFNNFYNCNATITGGTFKGGFNSTSGDQAPSLVADCGNTSIYGGTYEGNWIISQVNSPASACHDIYTKVYGKDLVVEGNHLMGTLCDGNTIDVNIIGYNGLEPSTVTIMNNCASFPKFAECGGKGGKSGKKTKSSLFRP